MKKLHASILCLMAMSTLTPALAQDNQSPEPIFVAMPAPVSMPSIIDNDTKSVPVADKNEEKTEAPKAIADATGDPASGSSKTPASFPKTGISGQFQKIGRFGASLPKRLPPTLICALGGTPIAACRQTVKATQDGIKDIVGDSKFPLFVAPALLVSIPYGLTAGALAGPVVGLYNGWKYSDDKPFSKDAFSMGSDK